MTHSSQTKLALGLSLGLSIGCARPARSELPQSAPPESARANPRELPLTPAEPTNEPAPLLVVDGQPFCFQGANNYYLHYQTPDAVRDVLNSAVAMQLKVLRLWSFLDRGSLDGGVPNVHGSGDKDGVYFQFWDEAQRRPAYNDGPKGLEKLDFVLHEARARGLRLILVLTNNWRDFGGMDQYLTYYGLSRHHAFYTDERVRKAYKDWVQHLVQRTNSIDGLVYRDDPAIMAWELANEPRTMNMTEFDEPEGWDTDTITTWAAEMSQFIHELDPNHLVSVGDEGFLASGGGEWVYEAPFGVDSAALTALEGVDFGTFHLYPDHWALPPSFGNDWIQRHLELARRLDKPYLLEEYGLRVERQNHESGAIARGLRRRSIAYTNWNSLMLHQGGSGALFWMLAGLAAPGQRYPDFDRFTIYRDEAGAELLTQWGERFPEESAACRLALAMDLGPPSPFVRVHRLREPPCPAEPALSAQRCRRANGVEE